MSNSDVDNAWIWKKYHTAPLLISSPKYVFVRTMNRLYKILFEDIERCDKRGRIYGGGKIFLPKYLNEIK